MSDRQRNFRIADAVRDGLHRGPDFSVAFPATGGFVARVMVRGRFKYRAFEDGADDEVARAMLDWCLAMGLEPRHATSPRTSWLKR
jgi:hypothetical protein